MAVPRPSSPPRYLPSVPATAWFVQPGFAARLRLRTLQFPFRSRVHEQPSQNHRTGVSLAMEGKFCREGLQSLEEDDDMLTAMAREPRRTHRPQHKGVLPRTDDSVGEEALLTAVREFVPHYRGERNHRGIGNLLISPDHSLADSPRTDSMPKPLRRNAQLLSSGGMITGHFSFWIFRGLAISAPDCIFSRLYEELP